MRSYVRYDVQSDSLTTENSKAWRRQDSQESTPDSPETAASSFLRVFLASQASQAPRVVIVGPIIPKEGRSEASHFSDRM